MKSQIRKKLKINVSGIEGNLKIGITNEVILTEWSEPRKINRTTTESIVVE